MANKYTITLSDGSTQFFVYDLEQNGPNNISISRQIKNVDLTGGAGTNYFEVNADVTYRFVAGFTFTVAGSGFGSPANNGTYTVAPAGSTYSDPAGSPAGTGLTSIPVVEAIATDGLPYGTISYSIPSAEEATSLLLSGRGYVNYGESLTSNIVHILENFANDTAPDNPITGQLWYDNTGGSPSASDLKIYNEVGSWATILTETGSFTLTGYLTLNADPVNPLHAATKQYVDTADALKVDVAGDTMTGLLTLSGDPTNALHAATKQYVDNSTFLPDYELQVGTGPSAGSPATPVEYTTSFNFSSTGGSPGTGKSSVMVFVNGVKQVEGASKSYVATAPNTISFNVGSEPAVSDDVEFYGFG